MDHPEISAGWLVASSIAGRARCCARLSQPQVGLDDLCLLPEDRRDGRADAFLALTARQPVRPWPITAFIWRHYKGRIGLLTLLQLFSACWRPWPALAAQPRHDPARYRRHHKPQAAAGLALFASVLAAGMLAGTPATGPSKMRPHPPPAGGVPARQGDEAGGKG